MTVVFSGTMKNDRKEMERIAVEEKGAKKRLQVLTRN
ncbi:MAG: hypothetical protein ACI87J_001983 [Colwellia sp.]|jgi:hypothetical protein